MKKWLLAATIMASSMMMTAPAQAAGLSTHMLMVDIAIRYVEDPQLKALLETHRDIVRSGAYFPDTGYIQSDQYGEYTHWAPSVRRYIEYVTLADGADGKPGKGCDVPTMDINSECAQVVAHLLGMAAHGLGDELWDSMFETQMAARGEDFAPPGPAAQAALSQIPGVSTVAGLSGGREYNMDIAAIAEFGNHSQQPHTPPPYEDVGKVLQRAIAKSNEPGFDHQKDFSITATDPNNMVTGYNALTSLGDTERSVAAGEADRVKQDMPWGYQYFYTESGGIVDTAQAMAKHWTHLWQRLHGQDPKARVIYNHPANGETNIPVDAFDHKSRIEFALDRQVFTDMVDLEQHACLFDENGVKVPATYGFRTHGHYYTIFPDNPLQPGKRYTVVLTDGVKDYRGENIAEPYTWWFVTAP